ncbi:hypothetical protein F2Q70_00036284 [Brassica cretica]|uniref:Uncharacterized protein n=1 Tax=Brassica cretica TaxID=69181 RepID=A0A8S9GC40_BRACR|nr:hypothetical protein F2Q68_00031466 [Brassica cretica]KAF2585946.1 hypothetical protein F2Q70_00036284 [Brassica cretica]
MSGKVFGKEEAVASLFLIVVKVNSRYGMAIRKAQIWAFGLRVFRVSSITIDVTDQARCHVHDGVYSLELGIVSFYINLECSESMKFLGANENPFSRFQEFVGGSRDCGLCCLLAEFLWVRSGGLSASILFLRLLTEQIGSWKTPRFQVLLGFFFEPHAFGSLDLVDFLTARELRFNVR